MKFKYNFLEKKLWRIEEDYFYEISEQNRKIEHFFMRGTKVSFRLGENHFLTLLPEDEFNIKNTVLYTKPIKNGEIAYYEKQIKRKWMDLEAEIIFEFTETDRKYQKQKNYD